MRAYVCRRYGGPEVLELTDVPIPVPKRNEILINVHATSVTSGDCRVRALRVPKGFGLAGRLALGITGPRQPILGTELSGIVESVGKDVRRFRPGDAVFAFPGAKMGCHAQYRAVAEDSPVALKPANLSHQEAAALCFGGSTALHFLGKADIKKGESILVVGASGAVGTMLVQLAAQIGAQVTGVTSTANLALVSSLGAHSVIDYTRESTTETTERYDVIADTIGATSYARSKHMLKRNGRLLAIAGGLPDFLAVVWVPMTSNNRVIAGPAQEPPGHVRQLAELAADEKIRPVIDRRYEFTQIAEAHAYVDTGRKRGSVVVSLAT